jgi:benzylsuccinate CoA-transferase BbsE subunit
MSNTEGALTGVRIIDLTDERGIYGAKLLADLGADVIRPEPPAGDPLRKRGPHLASAPEDQQSLWYAYFATNRRFFTVDLSTDDGQSQLQALIDRAAIVLTCKDSFGVEAAKLDAAIARREELVVIDVSSFGNEGPWSDFVSSDLVDGALGGAAATTGDADTPPLKLFGELNYMVSGAYAAIAALSALNHAKTTGQGQRVGVPVQQCIASCLEHVLMFHEYNEQFASADGPVLPRRGSLHWSNAYRVMQAKGGSIMITPTPNLEAQLFWLVEEDAFEDLIDPMYMEPENLPLMIKRMMEVLTKWVGEKDVEALFFTAQERHSPYGWVLPLEKVAENPQLEARDWWQDYTIGETIVKGPGAPYQFSETPWQINESEAVATTTDAILKDIGWTNAQEHQQ